MPAAPFGSGFRHDQARCLSIPSLWTGGFQNPIKTSLCACQRRQRSQCGFAAGEEALAECRGALFPTARQFWKPPAHSKFVGSACSLRNLIGAGTRYPRSGMSDCLEQPTSTQGRLERSLTGGIGCQPRPRLFRQGPRPGVRDMPQRSHRACRPRWLPAGRA